MYYKRLDSKISRISLLHSLCSLLTLVFQMFLVGTNTMKAIYFQEFDYRVSSSGGNSDILQPPHVVCNENSDMVNMYLRQGCTPRRRGTRLP